MLAQHQFYLTLTDVIETAQNAALCDKLKNGYESINGNQIN